MNETFNPWLEIWTQPRATIRRIVSENPNRSIWWLAAIYGFGSLMNNFQTMALGRSMTMLAIFLIALIFAAIWGYIFFSIWSAVVHWVGKLFKGEGSFQAVRAAYSWSCVPLAINIPLWVLLGVVFGHHLFSAQSGTEGMPNLQLFVLFFVLIARLILAVWSLVIYFNALAEVQQYSVLRAILNVIVAGILLSAAVWILWTIGLKFMHPGAQLPGIELMFWTEGFTLQTIQDYL